MRVALGALGVTVLIAAGVGAYVSQLPSVAPSGSAPVLPFAAMVEPQLAPDIRFQDAAGRERSLAEFRGKVVLLNVWATWCPPCRKEMPALDRLQAQLGGPEFEVLALSIDTQGIAAVRAFFKQVGIHALKLYVDPTMHAADALRIPGTPTTLLIDRSGREIAQHVGPAEWDAALTVGFLRKLVVTTRRRAARLETQ